MVTLPSGRKKVPGPDFWAPFSIKVTGTTVPERTVAQAAGVSVHVSLQCPGPTPCTNLLGKGNTRGALVLSKY